MWTEKELNDYTKDKSILRQVSIFSPDLFILYSEATLRELEVLPGFITKRYLKNIKNADDIVLMVASDNKHHHLDKIIIKKPEKNELLTLRRDKYVPLTRAIEQECKLRIGNVRIMPIQTFNSLGCAIKKTTLN